MEKLLMYLVGIILAISILFIGFKLLFSASSMSRTYNEKILFNLEDFCKIYISSTSEKYKLSFIKKTGIHELPVNYYKKFRKCIQGIQNLISRNKEYIIPGSDVDTECYDKCKELLNKIEECEHQSYSTSTTKTECILNWLESG